MKYFEKVYVDVLADFTPEGLMTPREIRWEDGRRFEITRVTDIRRAASLRAGGTGVRYTCLIGTREHYLYYEENYRWFVEAMRSDG